MLFVRECFNVLCASDLG